MGHNSDMQRLMLIDKLRICPMNPRLLAGLGSRS
jgi:hypothetical protein